MGYFAAISRTSCFKLTINAARSISTKMDDMSNDFKKLTQDKELTKSIRDLTIGLSKFLNEIYP